MGPAKVVDPIWYSKLKNIPGTQYLIRGTGLNPQIKN